MSKFSSSSDKRQSEGDTMIIKSSLSSQSSNDDSEDCVNIYNTIVDNIDGDGPDCLQRLLVRDMDGQSHG